MNASEIIAYLESRGLATAGVLIPPPSLLPIALVPICEDYLNDKLSADDLQQIGRVLLTRPDGAWGRDDYAPESEYPNNVELVLVEWYAPEMHGPDTAYHIRKFLAETIGETSV